MSLRRTVRKLFPITADLRSVAWLFFRHRARTVTCVCCGETSKFRTFGLPPRLNSLCTHCGSIERHRQFAVLFDRRPELVDGRSVLHFAPEDFLKPIIKRHAGKYVTCDIVPGRADLLIDIEAIDLPNASIETIVCNQVLEHVDDRKALPELYRILSPGGVALITVPVIEGWATTYENPAVRSPTERLEHFGQEDHVRYYGRDIRQRIRDAGFELMEFVAEEPDVMTYALVRGETIFIAQKATA